jgi:hypothetical protein
VCVVGGAVSMLQAYNGASSHEGWRPSGKKRKRRGGGRKRVNEKENGVQRTVHSDASEMQSAGADQLPVLLLPTHSINPFESLCCVPQLEVL